jgi:hypothetical protein
MPGTPGAGKAPARGAEGGAGLSRTASQNRWWLLIGLPIATSNVTIRLALDVEVARGTPDKRNRGGSSRQQIA